MNYFIDFEATQFSNGIISIGCVSEDGRMFYSIVNTKHKITSFITNLTGLTAAEIKEAPEPEEVFTKFYDWCEIENDIPHFFCYGNCDKDFVRRNFQECKNFKAASMLAYIFADMEDLSKKVKTHFGLCQNIGLKKVYDYYTGNDTIQQHNALEDAEMLKIVYENMNKKDPEFEAFPEYQQAQFIKKAQEQTSNSNNKDWNYTVTRMKNGKVIEEYPTLLAAVQWAYEQIPEGPERERTNIKNIAKEIRKAAKDPTKKYRNFKWTMTSNN